MSHASKRVCVMCGRDPAAGFASINDDWYCHGDEDEEQTCYMRATLAQAQGWPNTQFLVRRES